MFICACIHRFKSTRNPEPVLTRQYVSNINMMCIYIYVQMYMDIYTDIDMYTFKCMYVYIFMYFAISEDNAVRHNHDMPEHTYICMHIYI